MPAGLVLLLVGRWSWRQWLNRRRADGEYLYRALLMGDRAKFEHVAQHSSAMAGRASRSSERSQSMAPRHRSRVGHPRDRRLSDALDAIDNACVDTVIVTGADTIDPQDMRQLGGTSRRAR